MNDMFPRALQPPVILASRMNGSPEVQVGLSVDGIRVQMRLEDFVNQIACRMPLLTLTRARLRERLLQECKAVVEDMKAETNKVV